MLSNRVEQTKSPAPVKAKTAKDGKGPRNKLGIGRYGLIICWAALIVLFGVLSPTIFLSASNFTVILGSQAVLVVLTMGLLFPLSAGDFDLSVAANLTLSSMLIAVLNVRVGLDIGLAVLIALATGLLIGFVNGLLVVYFGVDSFIATLGMSTILTGLIYWISAGQTISGVSSVLVNSVFRTHLLGVPLAFYYGLFLCAVVWFIQQHTVIGRRLLYVGRGRKVSLLSGLHVTRLRWAALTVCGGVSALAGALYAGTIGGADPSSGNSYLLPAYAAVYLGATCLIPGRFNAWGTFVAVYFLVTGISGLQILGAENFVQQLFYGITLLLAVLLTKNRRGQVQESGALG